MFRMKQKKGFTILEMLVVFAIIGILAIITLSYLQRSKEKSANATAKTSLANARSQAEVWYINAIPGKPIKSYEQVCNPAQKNGIGRMVQVAAHAVWNTNKTTYPNNDPSAWNIEACHSRVDDYAAWVPLKESTSANLLGWCIDSKNANRQVTTRLSNVDDPANGEYQYECPPS